MIRQESLEEISDGKLYSENDCVKADTGNCAGSSQFLVSGFVYPFIYLSTVRLSTYNSLAI